MDFSYINDVAKQCESHQDILKILAKELKNHPSFPSSEAVTVGITQNAVVLRLHNSEQRPTTYEFGLRGRENEFPMHMPKITMDTIIAENESHHTHKQVNMKLDQALSMMVSYAQQPCEGHPDITQLKYQPLGLMMKERKQPLPPVDITAEAAEAVRFVSEVVQCDYPEQLKAAMVEAFNAGTQQGRWWVDQYFMQEVSRLVFDSEDRFLPLHLSLHGEPFQGAKHSASLYKAVATVEAKSGDVFSAMTAYQLYDFSREADKLTRALKAKYPALSSVKSVLPKEDYEAQVERFNGLDSAQAGAFNLTENLRPNTVKYNHEEQGRNPLRSVVSAVYSHAIAVAQEKNTRSAVRAMRDTILLHSREGFSVSNSHAILRDMQKSSYLDFCIDQAKDDFNFVTPEAIEILKISAEERKQKQANRSPQKSAEDRAAIKKEIEDTINEVIKEGDDPIKRAEAIDKKRAIVNAGKTFAEQCDSYEAYDELVLALVDVTKKAQHLPVGNEEFAAKYLHAEMEKHGFVMPEPSAGVKAADIMMSLSGGKSQGPICEQHVPIADIDSIPNIVVNTTPQVAAPEVSMQSKVRR